MVFKYQNLSFFAEILTKNHQTFDTKFHYLKNSSGKVAMQSTTYRTVGLSTFWQGMRLEQFP